MNVTDLQDILHERAGASGAEDRSHELLAGVHHRYAVRRRRRTIAGLAAGVVAVAALGAVAVIRPQAQVGPTPAVQPSTRTIDGFPEYADGARVVASTQRSGTSPRQLSVSFTPKTLNLVFWTRCTGEREQRLVIGSWEAGSSSGTCGPTARWFTPVNLAAHGVQAGEAVTVTYDVAGGAAALAVGEDVDPADYPYPSRPATLRPLDVGRSTGSQVVLRANETDPNRPVSVSFAWDGPYSASFVAQTPGRLVTTVQGKPFTTDSWWTYEQSRHNNQIDNTLLDGTKLVKGQPVTVTVTPERMTGDWALTLGSLADSTD
jgi:hypothetical protein